MRVRRTTARNTLRRLTDDATALVDDGGRTQSKKTKKVLLHKLPQATRFWCCHACPVIVPSRRTHVGHSLLRAAPANDLWSLSISSTRTCGSNGWCLKAGTSNRI